MGFKYKEDVPSYRHVNEPLLKHKASWRKALGKGGYLIYSMCNDSAPNAVPEPWLVGSKDSSGTVMHERANMAPESIWYNWKRDLSLYPMYDNESKQILPWKKADSFYGDTKSLLKEYSW